MAMKEFSPGEKIRAADFNDNFDETQKAENVTSGTFDAARIPDLDASKITTGVIDENRLPPFFPTYVGSRYFTSSGTFDRLDAFGDGSNIEAKAVKVRVQGGGGGSAGFPANYGGGHGGGGGGYAERFISPFTQNSTNVTVGNGGGGGASGGGNGASGGNSSFGSFATGDGGGGGLFVDNTGGGAGGGGSAPNGAVFRGDAGGTRTPGPALGGHGGSSYLGGGGRGGIRDSRCGGTSGGAGGLYGGGAGADASVCNGHPRPGRAGANGIVIVDIYV